MIYFLVNNDYHYFDAKTHASLLQRLGIKSSLIEIPHTLTTENRQLGFESNIRIDSPICTSKSWIIAWLRYFVMFWKLRKLLYPQKGDSLFLYTEYELLNHFVVQYFKRSCANVYLIEDGGWASYVPFTSLNHEKFTIKNRLIMLMIRCLPNLWSTQFRRFDGDILPWVADRWLSAICLYRPLDITRDVPVIVLKKINIFPKFNCIMGRVIFLNQPIYNGLIQTADDYLANLDKILSALNNGFSEVYFKFHPREDSEWINRLTIFLHSKHPKVIIIIEKLPIESILTQYRPEVIASYNSTPLLSLSDTGVQPMYLYHLVDGLKDLASSRQIDILLKKWEYQFIENFDKARSGYNAGVKFNSISTDKSIKDII